MAHLPHDPISATATDPPLCGICPNPSTITCTGCNNIKYCSAVCQERDAAQHDTLCGTFQNFQQRPSNQHYRSIYFPSDAANPRFIWLRMYGGRGYHIVDNDDLAPYVAGQPYGGITVTSHRGILPPREYKGMMVVEHDANMYGNRQPPNQCLSNLIGPLAARWLGGYVAHGYKYNYGMEMHDFEEADQDVNPEDFPLIALDLDTTSLGPLVAYLARYAQWERSGSLFGF